jgi:hypothetical protein
LPSRCLHITALSISAWAVKPLPNGTAAVNRRRRPDELPDLC